jgi:hypothetical protein
MPRIAHHVSGVAIGLGCVLFLSVATAQEAKMKADALFREGRQALANGQYAAACDMLTRSYELDPAPGTQLNLAECEALRGRVASAYLLFRAVEQQLDPNDVRAPIAKSKREAAESRLPRLVVKLPDNAPADTRVRISDRTFTPAELREPLIVDPGVVELTVLAPGHVTQTIRVAMEESKTTTVEGALVVEAAGQPPPAALLRDARPARPPTANGAAPAHDGRHEPSKGIAGAFLGVGIGGCLLGGIAGIVTLDAKRTNQAHCDAATQSCDASGRDAANRGVLFGALATTGLALGAVGVGVGTYLLVRKDREPNTTVQLRSTASGAIATFQQSF